MLAAAVHQETQLFLARRETARARLLNDVASMINAGEQVLQVPVSISGAQGAALVTMEFNGERRELLIVVGNPSPLEIPAVTAPLVGVQVIQ